jgi:hypothetical protein
LVKKSLLLKMQQLILGTGTAIWHLVVDRASLAHHAERRNAECHYAECGGASYLNFF